MAEYNIELKSVPAQMIAGIRDTIANYQSMGPLYDELMNELSTRSLTPAGPALGIFYDEGYKEKDVDVEAALPVQAEDEIQQGRFSIRELPGHNQVASLTRTGPWDNFTPAYQALMGWIEARGKRIIGPNREIYLKGPESGAAPEDFIVEIQFPIA